MRLTLGVIRALALGLVWLHCSARPAAAQERIDSSIRVWADVMVYSGEVLVPSIEVTSITPVLRAEVELSSWQLGLDLPLAFGDATIGGTLLEDPNEGFAARLANPTLHIDYVLEQKPFRATLGVALAIPTSDNDDLDADALRGTLIAATGAYARGMWNLWWYAPDAWTLAAPFSVDHATSAYELGLEGALAYYIPRYEGGENRGIFQIAARAGAVVDPAVIGLRLQGVLLADDIGDDGFQSAAELFAELRLLPVVWLGAGVLVALDEPLGFGDGAGFWGVRLSGGASF